MLSVGLCCSAAEPKVRGLNIALHSANGRPQISVSGRQNEDSRFAGMRLMVAIPSLTAPLSSGFTLHPTVVVAM